MKMRIYVMLTALLVAGPAGAEQSSAEEWNVASLYGRWEVAALHCHGCKPTPPLPPGMLLSLSATSAEATPAGRCEGETGYRIMHPAREQRRELQDQLPRAWGRGKPRWIAVTCDGLDFLVLAQWHGSALAYLADGDNSYLLRRLPAAASKK